MSLNEAQWIWIDSDQTLEKPREIGWVVSELEAFMLMGIGAKGGTVYY